MSPPSSSPRPTAPSLRTPVRTPVLLPVSPPFSSFPAVAAARARARSARALALLAAATLLLRVHALALTARGPRPSAPPSRPYWLDAPRAHAASSAGARGRLRPHASSALLPHALDQLCRARLRARTCSLPPTSRSPATPRPFPLDLRAVVPACHRFSAAARRPVPVAALPPTSPSGDRTASPASSATAALVHHTGASARASSPTAMRPSCTPRRLRPPSPGLACLQTLLRPPGRRRGHRPPLLRHPAGSPRHVTAAPAVRALDASARTCPVGPQDAPRPRSRRPALTVASPRTVPHSRAGSLSPLSPREYHRSPLAPSTAPSPPFPPAPPQAPPPPHLAAALLLRLPPPRWSPSGGRWSCPGHGSRASSPLSTGEAIGRAPARARLGSARRPRPLRPLAQ
nr:proline-rich protein 36-like [Aegilops tauschii subsp. strangulata]